MARFDRVLGLLRALGRASWRDARSLGSVGGQNFIVFLGFVALQPESAVFFALILGFVLLFPLASDPMEKLPAERRSLWPLLVWEWATVRVCSWALSPVIWLAAFLLVRTGWRIAAVVVMSAAGVQLITGLFKRLADRPGRSGPNRAKAAARWIPAPPGAVGAIMRLHWREMFRTLDPYLALTLAVATSAYRFSGRPLDPAALQIMALVVAIALSTQTQVLLGLDGHGAERYSQWPIRGWQILLAKDLAFLVLLGLLVLPLNLLSGIMGGIAALAIGHRRSVLHPVRQTAWRFTSGALAPDGLIQVATLFAVGKGAATVGFPLIAVSLLAWLASLFYFGWEWDNAAANASSGVSSSRKES